MAYIYLIENNINDKVYVGKTITTVEQRFREHCNDYKKPSEKNRPLYSAMRQYGVEHFFVTQLEEVAVEQLNEREMYWIEVKNSYKYGYNATKGGDGKPYLDYQLIYNTWLSNHNCRKTAKLCNCCAESVEKIVKEYGVTPSTGEALSKPVAKIDKETGEILEIYPSISAAEKENGNSNHIAEACNGKRKSCQGFFWKYLIDMEQNPNG